LTLGAARSGCRKSVSALQLFEKHRERHLYGKAHELTQSSASPRGAFVLFGVLFAAQHDDPKKQDRQHGTNDSNSGRIHRISPFLISVNSALIGLSFSQVLYVLHHWH
jgi:hypothetical protein